ncbi:MAG: hypothetical protein R3A46_13335 [Thermomicrobiales bacterium]
MDDQPLEPTVVALDAARQEQRDAVLALLGEAEAIVRGSPMSIPRTRMSPC